MRKGRLITAVELMAELQRDAQYQQRKADKERSRQERQKALDVLIEPYITQLHRLGFQGESLQEVVNRSNPLPMQAVEVLLAALGSLSEPRILESVVRALGASAHPFDGRPLACCFDSTDDEALKWVIVNTIAISHPHSIDDWLNDLGKSPYWRGKMRELGLDIRIRNKLHS